MTNLPRRSFLRLGAGVLAAAELPRAAWAKRAPLAPLELKQIEIAAGASRPFGAVHVSDTHIVRADKRDDARKITLAANRTFAPWGEHYLDEAIHAAEAAGEMLIHTGDLIDFVSAANLDMAEAMRKAREQLQGTTATPPPAPRAVLKAVSHPATA